MFAFAVLLLACTLAPQEGDTLRHAWVLPTEVTPVVDGVLDEGVWFQARAATDFKEVVPYEGRIADPKTEVRFLRGPDALHIGVICWEPNPENMVLHKLKRDSYLMEDDRIELVFDTFLDKRTAYFFQIGANGCRGDALIGDNGKRFNKRWDARWVGKTHIGDTFWSAEISIPFEELAFGAGDTWGMNIERYRGASRSEFRWSAPQRRFHLMNISKGGTLGGMADLPSSSAFEFAPYVKASSGRLTGPDSHDFEGAFGGEFNWRITPQLQASFTINTDFAETEADQQRVNLSRFPLFFPEKRDFFLEDSTLFEFGETRGFSGGGTLVPYFSRRIGLTSEGQEIPIRAGLRLAGRAGSWDLGMLTTQTSAVPELGIPESELFVFRPSFRVNSELSIGGLLTHGNPSSEGSNQLEGADLQYSQQDFLAGFGLDVNVFAMRTSDEDSSSHGSGWGLEAEMEGDLWEYSLKSFATQSDFMPALGFVRRPGERLYKASVSFSPRGEEGSTVRNYDFSISPSWWTGLGGDPISHEVDLKLFGIEFHDGDSFDIGVEFEGDRLMDSFSPGDGATISPGNYSWGRIEGERRWSSARPLSGSVRFGLGEWYDGHSQTASGSVTWRPSMHWGTSLRFFEGHFDLPGGDFASRSGRLSVNWSASPEFSVHNLLQMDNQSDQVGLQSRTHWLLEDGRELFFVINHGWTESANGSLIPGGQDFSLKLVWSLRI